MTHPEYVSNMPVYDRFTLSIQRQIIGWLQVQPGMRALDAGCGEGAFTLLMAEAGCRVEALDEGQEALDKASQLLAGTAFIERVKFHQGDIHRLPFEDVTFDLVWCSRVLHHTPDHVQAARELTRVLKPGGRLAVREGGPPLRILPFDSGIGELGLQDRIQVANNQWFTAMQRDTLGKLPFPYGWTYLMREIGIEQITARTFMLDAFPPFESAVSEWLARQLRRPLERTEYGHFLSTDDQEVLNRLTDPASPDYVIRRADLHIQIGESVYQGQKL